MKRFFLPNFFTLAIVGILWATGVEPVFSTDNGPRTNIQKYIQVQRYIMDNYVDDVSIKTLWENSLRGFVKNLTDSTIVLPNTPLDTTAFNSIQIRTLRESVLKFEEAYLYLNERDPDENMDKRTEDAIRFMFKDLDPHSIYIKPKDNERIQEEFAGKFQGIGVQFDIIHDTITVITPLSGGPSEQVGIESGDKIVTIDDSLAVGFTNEDVIRTLRGPKGSNVKVGVVRAGLSSLLYFNIIRDDIPLYTVDASYMLDKETGYVKINRFARTTHEEFITAVNELKDKGMERLILDLRNNPGGFMDQALRIVDEFLPKDLKMLSTKGRRSRFNQEFYATGNDGLTNQSLIVLINEGSASASEIVSGALQDHDLGLVVGRRSFGKGLVQQQYELVDGSSIRVTISKYYTPSGRLIQKPYSKGREAYAYELYNRENDAMTDVQEFIDHVPDSLRFSTDAGRIVYGGGGVVPDHIVQEDTTSSALLGLMRRNRLDVEFALTYMEENKSMIENTYKDDFDSYLTSFELDDSAMENFKALLEKNGYVESDTVKKVEIKDDKLFVPLGTFEKDKWIAQGFLKAYIARQVWGSSYFYPVYNKVFDTTLRKAMELWDDVHKLVDYRNKKVSGSQG